MIAQITKKYLLDLLNAQCFRQTINWAGIDQFNEFAIYNYELEEDIIVMEQRGTLLVHNKYAQALRLFVTTENRGPHKRICYRITNLPYKVIVSNPRKVLLPTQFSLDIVLADTSLGTQQVSNYSCYVNTPQKYNQELFFRLLNFIFESTFYNLEDTEVFKDLIKARLSDIPYPGDKHFQAIFEVTNDN